MEEGQLIRLLKEQRAEGLHILIQQYQCYVHTIISHVLGTHQEDIEECSSDTVVKVWRNKYFLMQSVKEIAMQKLQVLVIQDVRKAIHSNWQKPCLIL